MELGAFEIPGSLDVGHGENLALIGAGAHAATRPALASPVFLALSTFRQSDTAIDLAIEKARAARHLAVVFVVDVNLARYLVGTEVGAYSGIRKDVESDLLKKHKREGESLVESITSRAKALGIQVKSHVVTGRFALECLEIIRRENPTLIVTTRSKRPQWMRRLFGSPVDHLIAHAGCPVVEA
ncbi:MAG: universal stress protein [Planctomycetota bacterium]